MISMSSIALSQPTADARADQGKRNWIAVLISACLLMLVTVQAPEPFKVEEAGTQSILSTGLMQGIKVLVRALCIAILSYNIYVSWRKRTRRDAMNLLLPLFIFGVFGVGTVLWSAMKTTTIVQAGTFLILMLLSMVIATHWKDERDSSQILKYCSLVICFISCCLIFLHFAFPQYGALTRASSGIFHSTNAGASAAVGIIVLMASRTIWGWDWTRWLLVPGLLINLSAMFIGGNRLSMAVMILICCFIFVAYSHRIVLATVCFLGSGLGLLYLCVDPGLTLVDGVLDKVNLFSQQGQSASEINSLSGRAEMWETMWESFKESPLVGHGYFVTSETGALTVWDETGNWTAHNVYLQLLVTTGIVGVALFAFGVINIFLRTFFKLHSAEKVTRSTAAFVLIACTWYLTWGMLNESIFGPLQPESVIFAVILGLATAVAIRPNVDRRDSEVDKSAFNPALKEDLR